METSGAFARFDTHQVGARPRAVAPDCKRQARLAHAPVSRAPIFIGMFAALHPPSRLPTLPTDLGGVACCLKSQHLE